MIYNKINCYNKIKKVDISYNYFDSFNIINCDIISCFNNNNIIEKVNIDYYNSFKNFKNCCNIFNSRISRINRNRSQK